jgi:hypothetical protein
MNKKYFFSVSQKEFNLIEALSASENYLGLKISPQPALLKEAIQTLLSE